MKRFLGFITILSGLGFGIYIKSQFSHSGYEGLPEQELNLEEIVRATGSGSLSEGLTSVLQVDSPSRPSNEQDHEYDRKVLKNRILAATSFDTLHNLYRESKPFDFENKSRLLSKASQFDYTHVEELNALALLAFDLSKPQSQDTPLDDRHLDHIKQVVDLLYVTAKLKDEWPQTSELLRVKTLHPSILQLIVEKGNDSAVSSNQANDYSI